MLGHRDVEAWSPTFPAGWFQPSTRCLPEFCQVLYIACAFTGIPRCCRATPAMNLPTPHYLLFAEANGTGAPGRWRFLLRNADGSEQFEAADMEAGVQGERLDLLTVVRALESLDQPSRVTLIGCSRYIRHGMQYGLSEWRVNGWRWESFGQLVPIKNGDLWQRMDRAMRFHRVECCQRRLDPPHRWFCGPHTEEGDKGGALGGCMRVRFPGQVRLRCRVPLLPRAPLRRSGRPRCLIAALLGWWRRRAIRSWTALKPSPRSG